jgi:VWFA-related protein
MKTKRGLVLCCAVLLLLPALVITGDYQVQVTTIEVWVKAVDSSGNPVTDLKQDDFEIYEDRVKVKTGCFEQSAVSLIPSQTQTSTADVQLAPAPKKFVLFLDLLNTTPAEYAFVKPKMQQFLDQISGRNWEVLLAALMPNGKLGLISPFTTDINRIHTLLSEARANDHRDIRVLRNVRELQDLIVQARETSADLTSVLFTEARNFTREDKDISVYSMDALASFANYLQKKADKERTIILYVSGGFQSEPGRIYYNMLERAGYADLGSMAAVTNPAQIPETNFDFQREVQKGIGSLNRFNVTLYAINTRGLAGSGTDPSLNASSHDIEAFRDYQNTLDQIAHETGGVSFANSNNFKVGFDQVFTDLDHQYMLCYDAPEHRKTGEYHHIRVVCKRPGVQIRYRQGYLR